MPFSEYRPATLRLPTTPGWLPEHLPSDLLGRLFESHPDMVFICDSHGRIIAANTRALSELGYQRSDLDGQPIHRLVPAGLRDRHVHHLQHYLEHPSDRHMGSGIDVAILDAEGNQFAVDIQLSSFQTGDSRYILTVCRRLDADVARRQAQIHALVESAREYAVNLLDPQGRILTWNEGARRVYGLSATQALGADYSLFFSPEEIASGEPTRHLQEAARAQGPFRVASWFTTQDGSRIWAEIEVSATRDSNGQLTGFTRVLHDLTAHKQVEEELEKRVAERTRQLEETVEELRRSKRDIEAYASIVSRDLREKEVLLREVYHRVKNNLQVVQSLLKMRARTLNSDEGRRAIETAVQRVGVIAMVHERLYNMPDLAGLSLSTYISDLVRAAVYCNTGQPEQVQLKIEADNLALTLDLGIPFGLLVNELISNCLKHGLPNGRRGTITVSARAIPGALRFVVQDSGDGLPADFDPARCCTMGLKLAASLAHQLGGSLAFSSDHGCRIQADLTRLLPHPAA